MKNAAPKAIAVQQVIDDVMRRDGGRLLAGLIYRLGDFQRAEDALQEAFISALKHWSRSGIPDRPTAWLMKVGLNKGIDRVRAQQRDTQKTDDLSLITCGVVEDLDLETIPDERLRLIFTCCHPALEEKSRVALTLRTVCHLTTREIAAAFLDSEQTMGQRLSRAKAKIKAKGIGFSIPERDRWSDRLDTVLSTIYLIFTTGYVNEDEGNRDLCQEAIFLIRLLNQLREQDPEIEGALALMLFTDARRQARIDDEGVMVPIEAQSPMLWGWEHIREAQALLRRAVNRGDPGPFQIKAAIADCHMAQPKPDWLQISFLYQSLWTFEPTPVVALNWAVVMAETGQVELALQKLDQLETELCDFQPWQAAKAHLLEKCERYFEAQQVLQHAIKNAPTEAAKKFLQNKCHAIESKLS